MIKVCELCFNAYDDTKKKLCPICYPNAIQSSDVDNSEDFIDLAIIGAVSGLFDTTDQPDSFSGGGGDFGGGGASGDF